MANNEFEVVIVGAGPGGLWAAQKLAKKGIKTLCLDKRQEVGAPVRCGEGLGKGWFDRLGLEPKKEFIAREMTGAYLVSPSGKGIVLDFKKPSGYILERRMFEKYLAREAARAGAIIRVKTRVTDVIKENGKIVGVKVIELGEVKDYRCNVVIAADGIESLTARRAGLNTTLPLYHTDSGFQYEMAGIDFPHTNLIHLYFGTKIANRGYVWLFGKGEHEANVGIGILGSSDKKARECLDEWIATQPGLKKGSIVHVNYGGIPVGGLLEKMTMDGLIVIGDAAHQVNPIHGGGIGLSMEAGALAADIIEKAKKLNDYSDKTLSEYTTQWYEKRGNELKKILGRRKMFEELTDEDFETIVKAFSGDDIMKLVYGNAAQTAALVTKKLVMHPRLLKLLLKYLAAPKE